MPCYKWVNKDEQEVWNIECHLFVGSSSVAEGSLYQVDNQSPHDYLVALVRVGLLLLLVSVLLLAPSGFPFLPVCCCTLP